MNLNSLGSGSAVSAYVNSLLAKSTAQGGSNGTANTATTANTANTANNPSKADTAMANAASAALSTASHSLRSTVAQSALEKKESSLATDLRAAMSKAGVTLGAAVEFSIGSNGSLSVQGSDADKAAVAKFMGSDRSQPSFGARIQSLAASADSLSNTIRQSAAMSQAARYAGSSSNVLSLYGSLLQQQNASPAVFSLSSSTSSLTYPGVLAWKA